MFLSARFWVQSLSYRIVRCGRLGGGMSASCTPSPAQAIMDGCGIISSCQSAAYSEIVKRCWTSSKCPSSLPTDAYVTSARVAGGCELKQLTHTLHTSFRKLDSLWQQTRFQQRSAFLVTFHECKRLTSLLYLYLALAARFFNVILIQSSFQFQHTWTIRYAIQGHSKSCVFKSAERRSSK